jgi:hypothetical protein
MLTRIAILVDKYMLHEVAEMFTDTWFQGLDGAIPDSTIDDLVTGICVFWIFGKSDEFNGWTRFAQLESKGRVDGKGLPIPSSIIGEN